MIISRSYFKGLLDIPNIEDTAPNSSLLGNVSELDLFIREYERDYLIKALGYSLNKEFQSHLEVVDGQTEQTVRPDAPQKWKDLMDGKEYSKDGKLVNWRGLVFDDNGDQKSPIAPYVCYHFLKNDLSRWMGTGIQTEKAKNSVKADPAPKAVAIWQLFYRMTVENVTDEVALFEFIEDMNDLDETTYPHWIPYRFGKRNIMGI
ncbi:hypothetical protein FGF1_03430 [Flavobacteriaceae bacterium GF1]